MTTENTTTKPKDVDTCHALIDEMNEKLSQKDFLIEKLNSQIENYLRHRYGQRADRIDPNQFLLFKDEILASLSEADEADDKKPAPRHRKKKKQSRPGRNPFPKDLERDVRTYDIPEKDKKCKRCGADKKHIGEAYSEQLEFIPATVKVIEHHRKTYACPNECEDEMLTADKPVQVLEKSYAGPGLLAHIVVGKYQDHLPLNRQEDILKRHNVKIPQSTQGFWMKGLAGFLLPLYLMMKERVLSSEKIHSDDTTLCFLEKGKGKAQKGKLWVYLGDEKNKYAVFDFTRDRKQAGPLDFLKGFTGYLQADAYAGYKALFGRGKEKEKATEVGCWAHARRKYTESQNSGGITALTAIAFIKQLYEVEKEAKHYLEGLPVPLRENIKYDLFVKKRHKLRQEKSVGILEKFKEWLTELQEDALPKGRTGEAITYTLNQWDALNVYTKNGILEMDNNAAERAMKHIATGRKNYLFAGNEEGGRTAAVLYTFLYTAKLLKINPFEYLKDVFTRMPACGPDELEQFLPDKWKSAQEELKLLRPKKTETPMPQTL